MKSPLTAISQGLKAGLAAGVIYGLTIGILHLVTLLGCSGPQIAYIGQHIPPGSNATASGYFYGTDIVYYPMVYGSLTLIFGVIFGLVFAFLYRRLPGSNSKIKGVALGGVVFLFDFFVGPGFFTQYACGSSPIPYVTFAFSIPAGLVFGYFLGSFYDSFGRLEIEETQERKEDLRHWSELFKRNNQKEKKEESSPQDEPPADKDVRAEGESLQKSERD